MVPDVLQVFSGEREQLHATLDSQDASVQRAHFEQQRLRNEAARLNQLLQAKDQVIRWVNFCLSIMCVHFVTMQYARKYTRGRSVLWLSVAAVVLE